MKSNFLIVLTRNSSYKDTQTTLTENNNYESTDGFP